MYAIIKTGGKQYRVALNDVIDVELLEAEEGAEIKFDSVLLFNDGSEIKIGSPHVGNGCVVVGQVLAQEVGGPKIMSVKYKRSHHQYRKFGHRQHYTRIKITEIKGSKKESKKER